MAFGSPRNRNGCIWKKRYSLAVIDEKGTQIDIVLNNAGVQVAYRDEYLKTPMSDYETSFKINTMAPMMICYHFLPKMVERGFGRIVNTSSGIQLDPQQAEYSIFWILRGM